MNRQVLIDVLLGTVLFVALAIVIGTGIRLVDWLSGGQGEDVWRAAVSLIVGATAGASAFVGLRKRGNGGVD
jgi:hypothetical protein